MKLVPVHNSAIVEAVAKSVSDYVENQFSDRDHESDMALKIKECPEYKQMNNSEYWLGVMTGLNAAKDKAFAKFMSLKEESDDEDDYDFDDR